MIKVRGINKAQPPSLVVSMSDPHPHGNHPSYESLLMRIFRESRRPHWLHLTSLRARFQATYLPRYYFPPNWSKHLYQRLREMERKGLVESSGPGLLLFKLVPGKAIRKARKRQRGRKIGTVSKHLPSPPTSQLASPIKLETLSEHTDMSIVKEQLESLSPLIDHLDGRMSSHLSLLLQVLQASLAGDLGTAMSIISTFDDHLEDVPLEEHLEQLESILAALQKETQTSHTSPKSLQALQETINELGRLQKVVLGEHVSTMATIISSLMVTMEAIKANVAPKELLVKLVEKLGISTNGSLNASQAEPEEQSPAESSEVDFEYLIQCIEGHVEGQNAQIQVRSDEISGLNDQIIQLSKQVNRLSLDQEQLRAQLEAISSERDNYQHRYNHLKDVITNIYNDLSN